MLSFSLKEDPLSLSLPLRTKHSPTKVRNLTHVFPCIKKHITYGKAMRLPTSLEVKCCSLNLSEHLKPKVKSLPHFQLLQDKLKVPQETNSSSEKWLVLNTKG